MAEFIRLEPNHRQVLHHAQPPQLNGSGVLSDAPDSSCLIFPDLGSFQPQFNRFVMLLWDRFMGPVVYATGIKNRDGAHVYCRSRKDGQPGCVYLIINNSRQTTLVDLPTEAIRYALTGKGQLRNRAMLLNGRELKLCTEDPLPELVGAKEFAGTLKLPGGSCTFLIF